MHACEEVPRNTDFTYRLSNCTLASYTWVPGIDFILLHVLLISAVLSAAGGRGGQHRRIVTGLISSNSFAALPYATGGCGIETLAYAAGGSGGNTTLCCW